NFHYVFVSANGDITITARVASQQNTNLWAKSGVMIRESTAADSAYVFVFLTPGHGVNMQYRASTGASAAQLAQIAGPVAPYWVRLVRSRSTFTGFTSSDGASWSPVGSLGLTMSSTVQTGLAVTAHNDTVLNSSTFDGVAIPAQTQGPTDGATEYFPGYYVQNRTNRPLDQVYGTYIDPSDGTTKIIWTNVCSGEHRTELRWQTWANQNTTNIEDYDMMFDSDTQRTAVSQIKSNTGGEAVYLQVTDPGSVRNDGEHHTLIDGIDGQWHHW